jgi:superfamily II DNA or RNA helicase
MQEFFTEVRENTSSETWSKGVRLARSGNIIFERREESGYLFRIIGESKISPTTTIWIDDCEWHCDCKSPDDPCHHVVGATILLKQKGCNEKILPRPKDSGTIIYDLKKYPEGIGLDRYILSDEKKEKLTISIGAISSSRMYRTKITLSSNDMGIEHTLRGKISGAIEKFAVEDLFKKLTTVRNLTFEGKKINIDPTPLGTRAVVRNHREGVSIAGELDPEISELFKNGVVLKGSTLHPLSDVKLEPREAEMLKRGQSFLPKDYANLVSVILPALERRIPVDIQTNRLPSRTRAVPRSVINTVKDGHKLKIISYMVYGDPAIARVQGNQVVAFGDKSPIRDIKLELKLKTEFYREFGFELGKTEVFERSDAVTFAKRLKLFRGEVTGDGQEAFKLFPPLTPTFTQSDSDFNVNFNSQGKEAVSAEAVFDAWKTAEAYVPLVGGGYAPIPTIWLMRYGSEILELLSMKKECGSIPKAAYPFLADVTEKMGLEPSGDLSSFRDKLKNFDGIKKFKLPDKLDAKLRDYQHKGVDFLAFLKSTGLGGMLADDMGLGKTLQALTVVDGRTLVIAPTSVIYNWKREVEKFRSNLTVNMYHGKNRSLDTSSDITITTYALLRIEAETFIKEKWNTVILDEAQNIKNPKSQAAQTAFQLNADFRLVMTGTPVENNLNDLWSQFNFINPGLLGGLKFFGDSIAKPIGSGDVEALKRLKSKIRPFVLRRHKNDVAKELPPKTETLLYAELSKDERKLYEIISAAARKDVLEKLQSGGSVMDALEALLRLRQACTHPSLVPGKLAKTSAKLDLLIETLTKIIQENHKAIVFSQWTSFLDIIEESLVENKMPFLRLDGSTRNRQKVVDDFQSEDGPPVLIMSLKAGGVGLNLTAADNVFIMDPWWNPAAETQAADRTHRIGQDKPVIVHKMVTIDTVEEKIIALQEQKKRLSESVLSKSALAKTLTRDDILNLLQ